MSRLRVWAPRVSRLELQIDERRLPMQAESGGWRSIDSELISPGVDYSFVLDGGAVLPDPRSQFQPHGVHGASRVVDHEAFRWTDIAWNPPPLSSAIIYELHIGTFTDAGTFDAAIERLPHLVDLGTTHIELMPVAEFSGERGWGYDGVDLFAPHHAYGGPEGLKRLVDACHGVGLAVIMDVVYNHFGPAGNYWSQFGPYLTARYQTPWGQALNLDDEESDEIRRFLCDSALMWLRDYHCDGLRIDAVHAIFDRSAIHFLEQLAVEVARLQTQIGRRFTLIAESDLNDPRIVRPIEAGGYGIDAQWSDDFHHALHSYLTGERNGYYLDFGTLDHVAKALHDGYVYDGGYSNFRRRRHGRPAFGLSGHRFIAYLQNHDQIGNRAKGERSSMLISAARLKIAAGILFTSPFIPMLFQGEEWGASTPFLYFTSHPDAQLGRMVREGRASEFAAFGWDPKDLPDPQSRETFERSVLNWHEISREPHLSLLAWHRELIALRKRLPELVDGRLDSIDLRWDGTQPWLLIQRGEIAVACNFSDRPQSIEIKASRILLASNSEAKLSSRNLEIPTEAIVIAQTASSR